MFPKKEGSAENPCSATAKIKTKTSTEIQTWKESSIIKLHFQKCILRHRHKRPLSPPWLRRPWSHVKSVPWPVLAYELDITNPLLSVILRSGRSIYLRGFQPPCHSVLSLGWILWPEHTQRPCVTCLAQKRSPSSREPGIPKGGWWRCTKWAEFGGRPDSPLL